MFELIKNIDIKDPKNWKNKVFLTFDIDWCSDEVLGYTLDLLDKYNVKAIFFVTHHTRLLDRIKTNENFELGIHPNFNFLLNGDFKYGKSVNEIVKYYLEIVPNAESVRSHSLTQSSLILDTFRNFGLKYSFNTLIPFSSKIEIKPYKLFNGITEYPHFWEDDVHCIYGWEWNVKKFLNYKSLKIFDFHPIHIFLNTEDLRRYNKAKSYLQDDKRLKEFINSKTYGTKNFLIDLIERVMMEKVNE